MNSLTNNRGKTLSVIVSLAVLPAFFFACGEKQQSSGNTPPPYAVVTLQPASVELKSTFPATIKGRQDIEIRPKVAGFITEVLVDEGSVVRKGQTLFVIDPVSFQAAFQVTEANRKVAETAVQTSRLTLTNKTLLREQRIISDYELQMATNELAIREAQLAQANAQLLSARNDLSYTRVISPSDGVVGNIPYRLGSLVSSSIATPLTIVSDISEMHVYFSLTEKQTLTLIKEGGTVKEIVERMPPVELQLSDGMLYPEKGKIETLSGVIDPNTGATTLRANFPNGKNILRSGGSGTILLPYVQSDALLIPQTATYEIQDKKFVYLLTDSSVVKSTEVGVLSQNDGRLYVVTSGLKAGDRIVVEGVSSLRDGVIIRPVSPEEADKQPKAASR